MELELKKPKAKDKNALNEDEAIAAFAEFTAGSGEFTPQDPALALAAKKKKEEGEKAALELQEL